MKRLFSQLTVNGTSDHDQKPQKPKTNEEHEKSKKEEEAKTMQKERR